MSRTVRTKRPTFKLGTLVNKQYKNGKVRDGTPTHAAGSCQRNGGCLYCHNNRFHSTRKREPVQLKEEDAVSVWVEEKARLLKKEFVIKTKEIMEKKNMSIDDLANMLMTSKDIAERILDENDIVISQSTLIEVSARLEFHAGALDFQSQNL